MQAPTAWWPTTSPRLDMPGRQCDARTGRSTGPHGAGSGDGRNGREAGLDPIAFRILNEPEVVPGDPSKKFSDRNLVRCLREGAERFN